MILLTGGGGASSLEVSAPGGVLPQGGCLLLGGLLPGRGVASSRGVETPRLLLRAVRILLECILVLSTV